MLFTCDKSQLVQTLQSMDQRDVHTIDMIAFEGKLMLISPRVTEEIPAVIEEPGGIHNVFIGRVLDTLEEIYADGDVKITKNRKWRIRLECGDWERECSVW